jgi:hypothetical protein
MSKLSGGIVHAGICWATSAHGGCNESRVEEKREREKFIDNQ